MKKLFILLLSILSTQCLHAQNPLRVTKAVLFARDANSFDVELTIAGGTPGYVYEVQETVVGPTSATTVTLEGIMFLDGDITVRDQNGEGASTSIGLISDGLLAGRATEASFTFIHPTDDAENGQIIITNNSDLEQLVYGIIIGTSQDPIIDAGCTNNPSCIFTRLAPDDYRALTEVVTNAPTTSPISVSNRLVNVAGGSVNTIYRFLQTKFCTAR